MSILVKIKYDHPFTGGMETTKEFVSKLDLKPGQKVLDVGCGIGGGDFYMAENYDVEVVGIDLSINMISFALERSVGLKCAVEFEVADCTKKDYPENSFDVIYSRDTILHIQDKPALFRSFLKWLEPGGKVLLSDYCKSAGPPSPEFASYIKQRGYDLHDVKAYGQVRRLAKEIQNLTSSRQITVVNGSGGIDGSSLILPAATLGALGYGYSVYVVEVHAINKTTNIASLFESNYMATVFHATKSVNFVTE